MKILIRMDADHHVGLAHAVRVSRLLAVGRMCFGTAWDFEVHLMGHVPEYANFFKPTTQVHGFSEKEDHEDARARAVVRVAAEIDADVVMVDHPYLGLKSWRIFSTGGCPVIAIDDVGGPVIADVILNGTVLDAYHHYPHMADRNFIHCGGKYALINPCFGERRWKNPPDASLITVIGSGDRACDWALRLTGRDGALTHLPGLRKTMVVGSAFPQWEKLQKQCLRNEITLYQGLDQPAMAELLSDHRLGLITGGMIVYEALATGLPVAIFPQIENLPPEAHYFSEKGCALDLGYDGGMDMTHVAGEIRKIIASSEGLLRLSRKSVNMIDGKGMERAVKILHDFFLSLHGANTTGEKE